MAGPCPHFQCLFRIYDWYLPPMKKVPEIWGKPKTPVNTSSSLKAELLRQAAGGSSILISYDEHVLRWHCRAGSNPGLPWLPPAERHSGDKSGGAEPLLTLLCGWKEKPKYSRMQSASKPITRLHGTLLPQALSPGLKLIHGTEGREEKVGEHSERRLISALGG